MAILFLCCGHEKNWRWVALGGEAGETHLGQTPVRRKPLQPQQPDRGHSADTSVPKLTPSRATRPRAYCWTLPRVCAALLRWWLTGTLSFFFHFLFCIGVQPADNVVTVSGEKQGDSAIHIHGSTLPQTPLPSRLPPNIEQSSLCYPGGPFGYPFLI